MLSRLLCAALLFLISFAPPLAAQTAEDPAAQAEQGTPTPSQTLIDILEDDTARAALIAQLRAAAGDATEAVPPPPAPLAEPTVAQQIVSEVTGVVGSAADVARRTVQEIVRVSSLIGDLSATGVGFTPEMMTLFLVVSAVVGSALLGKLALDQVIRRNPITALTTIRRRFGLIALYAGLRLLSLAVVWGVGYAVALMRASGGAGPSPTEAIFLTTVLVFGLCRIALRVIVTPDAEHEPTLSHLHPRAQEAVYRSLRGLMAALTFSFMFILPLVREWIGFATVRPMRTLLATLLMIMAIVTLRRIVGVLDIARNSGDAERDNTGAMLTRGAQSVWRSIWPPLASVYILYCWLVAVTQPRQLSDIVLGGTVWSVIAVLLALVSMSLLRLSGTLHLPMPGTIDRSVPDLARRFSGVVRMLSGVASVIVGIAAVVMALSAWRLLDAGEWISDPDVQLVLWRIVSAILLAAFLSLVWAVIASVVDQRLRGAALIDNSRARTLLGLFRNAFTLVVGIIGTMVVLSQLGIDIAPLLAGAGVIGLAIGFGSQKLVQDIITGVFIQMENAINEGDVVGVAGITGGVEKLSIRSVRLRTLDGAVHIVPFSSVDTVTNLTRDFSFHLAEIGVAYKEKVPEVIAAMQAAFDTLRAGEHGPDIIDDFEMHGVTALGDSSVTIRARIKTKPGKQWGLGRDYTALVKEEFDARGIEIPFPHRQLMLPPEFIEALAGRKGDDAKVIEG